MTGLVANNVDDAVSPMEPDFVNALGRTQAEAQIKKPFDYFGRPLDSEFKHDKTGFKIHLDGHKSPMRKFYYAATTDQNASLCGSGPDRFYGSGIWPIEASIRRASGLVKIISLSRQQPAGAASVADTHPQ